MTCAKRNSTRNLRQLNLAVFPIHVRGFVSGKHNFNKHALALPDFHVFESSGKSCSNNVSPILFSTPPVQVEGSVESFHYERDVWRVNVVRNSGAIEGVSAAGFHDAALWEEAKRHGDGAVKKLIDSGLQTSTVTVVLIGSETASRKYVSYEVEQSVTRGNGILGIRINNIKDQNGRVDPPGQVPVVLAKTGAPIYTWEYGKLGEWVESAYKRAKGQS